MKYLLERNSKLGSHSHSSPICSNSPPPLQVPTYLKISRGKATSMANAVETVCSCHCLLILIKKVLDQIFRLEYNIHHQWCHVVVQYPRPLVSEPDLETTEIVSFSAGTIKKGDASWWLILV